jgi:hypothetical protein
MPVFTFLCAYSGLIEMIATEMCYGVSWTLIALVIWVFPLFVNAGMIDFIVTLFYDVYMPQKLAFL